MFERFTDTLTRWAGSPAAVVAFVAIVVLWLITGPVTGFSDTWQLLINTATTISTGLLVFVIQASQNKDTKALQTKLDTVLKYLEPEDANKAIGIEELPREEVEELDKEIKKEVRK